MRIVAGTSTCGFGIFCFGSAVSDFSKDPHIYATYADIIPFWTNYGHYYIGIACIYFGVGTIMQSYQVGFFAAIAIIAICVCLDIIGIFTNRRDTQSKIDDPHIKQDTSS